MKKLLLPIVFSGWTPKKLFAGKQGLWYEPKSLASLFQDTAGLTPVAAAGQPVGLLKDKSGNTNNGVMAVDSPVYQANPPRVTLDRSNDLIRFTVPAGGWIGTMVLSTTEGTLAYSISLPQGTYTVGGVNHPGPDLVGLVIRNGIMTDNEIAKTYAYFANIGGGPTGLRAYHKASLSNYFKGGANIFSNVTAISTFDTSTLLNASFYGCALTQASVDAILASVAQSVAAAPSLINGTLDLSGGINDSPSSAGLTAKQYLMGLVSTQTGQAIFGYGYTGTASSLSNLVSNTGVVATDTTGVGTARYYLAAAGYGGDKAIFGYGYTGSYVSMTNLVSN